MIPNSSRNKQKQTLFFLFTVTTTVSDVQLQLATSTHMKIQQWVLSTSGDLQADEKSEMDVHLQRGTSTQMVTP
jgi:hypothetical protein